MQNASLAAFLHLEGSPFAIPLDASHYHWQQQIDHRGRPRSKVRAGSWRFATSLLDQASYQHLLELMLSPTTVVEARATYGRADGQGTFVTVWGRHCTVSHVFSHFDARGTHGREAGWTLYFTLSAEEMGREAGTAGAFVMPAARSYDQTALSPKTASGTADRSYTSVVEGLFRDKNLTEIRQRILSGNLPRRHADLISVEEQAIIAYYTTSEGYREFNLALRGQVPKTIFFADQEKVLNKALSKLPKHTGSAVRGTGASETERFSTASVGDVINYENFVSTSLDEAIADDFMYRKKGEYILRILSKKGVNITQMSLAPAEDEVLFSSNTKFRVAGKSFRPRFTEDDPLVREIYLEEI